MKLVYLLNKINGRGGLNRIAFDKMNYLINYYQIDVIYYGHADDRPFYDVDKRINFHNIEIDPLSTFYKKFRLVLTIYKRYNRIINLISPDIIINMNTNILSWIVPFIHRRIPKVIELHQSYNGVQIFNENNYGKNNYRSKFSMFLRNMIYPSYDRVVVLTRKDKQQWGYGNMLVIGNYTNMKNDIPIDTDNKKFIWIGRLSHQKGIDLLVEVWKKFVEVNSEWSLFLIGNTPDPNDKQKNALINFVSSPRYSDRIIYVDETSEITKYYRRAAIYLSTSRYEGLPLCLIEAATMGLPIIGFDITGNDEVVINNENGYLIRPYDIQTFVDKMEKLISSRALLKEYSKMSLKQAQKFDKEIIMKKWIQLFECLKK